MDHHLNQNSSRLHDSPRLAQEYPSISNIRIFLVGELSSVGQAFYQVSSKAGAGISLIPFDAKDVNQALDAIDKQFPEPSPALMVSASDAAWAALRVLNVWQLDAGVFQPVATNPPLQIPIAIPLPHIQPDTIFDLFATRWLPNGGWLSKTLDVLARANRHVVDPSTVKRAILHYVAAKERHDLQIAHKATTHGRNDAVAAIRIIQGAALNQSIAPGAAKKSCQEVGNIGEYFTSPHTWDGLQFFQLLTRLGPTSLSEPTPFASILVADDEGFWSRPMEPIWNSLGFRLVSQPDPAEVPGDIKLLATGDTPVRAVFLDMELHGDRLGGARLLQVLHRMYPHVPVIALSVDDQFSETVLLKRMGAFAYLNKHALAEPDRGRDALSAFRQLKDSVITAGFASLSAELTFLSDAIAAANTKMIKQQKAREAEELLSPLDHQIRESLFVYVEECRRIFRGCWQDSPYPCGTACRQIIRAVGLMNDQWTSLWGRWRFDPDGYRDKNGVPYPDPVPRLDLWLQGGDLRFPSWPYHEITTAIRNAAAHATVRDSDFSWRDVWIGFLSLFLKMEAVCRGNCKVSMPSQVVQLEWVCDNILRRLARTLQGLIAVSANGSLAVALPDPMTQTKPPFGQVAAEIQRYLDRLPRDDKPLKEGDPAWISLEPYHRAFRTRHEVMKGFLEKCGTGLNLTPAQSSASLLLLNLIAHRLAQTPVRNRCS